MRAPSVRLRNGDRRGPWRTTLPVLVGLLFAALSGCSASEDEPAATVYIGFLNLFEDASSTQTRVAQLLVPLRRINAAGGVELADGKRHKVDLIAADHGGTVEGTISALDRLAEQGVTAVVGPPWSSLMLGSKEDYSDGAAAHARELGMMLVSGAATASAISHLDDDGLVFRTVAADDVQANVGARHLYESQGVSTAAVIFRQDAWGSGLSLAFQSEFEALGGNIVAAVGYDADEDFEGYDFSAELDAVFRDKPQAVYFVNFAEFLHIANQIATGAYLEAYEEPPVFFGTDGVYPQDVVTNVPEEILLNLSGTISASDHTTADYQLLESLVREDGLGTVDIDTNRHDALYLIALAMQAGGSTDAQEMKKHMIDVSRADAGDVEVHLDDWDAARTVLLEGGTVNYEGPSGSIEFDENGDRTEGTIAIWEVVSSGGKYQVNADNIVAYRVE